MTASDAVFIFPSPFGPLALTGEEFDRARQIADAMVPTHREGDNCDRVSFDAGNSRLLDADETARLLSIKPSWLIQRAREDRLPHYRVGKYIRFDVNEIRALTRKDPDRHANSQITDDAR